jgi:hypothetical protein
MTFFDVKASAKTSASLTLAPEALVLTQHASPTGKATWDNQKLARKRKDQ